ncbi:hypothetical protein BST81_15265 [Leptolyngbya sp. 'hensonii']|nr:hypothetical protein BST81_15265 [Leptolyngbya sp. 'hensonii']
MFESRPFTVQTQAESISATPTHQSAEQSHPRASLNQSFLQAQRFGHHLSQIAVHTTSTTDTVSAPRKRRRQNADLPPLSGLVPEEEDSLQRQAEGNGSFEAGNHLETRIKEKRGGGQPLDQGVRSFMEPRFGHSFADVRVHADGDSVQMNRELHAEAFTNGQHIYFNEGKYNPNSGSGKQLLAHELTHTIQQTGGSKLQRKEGGHCSGCSCPSCGPAISRVQRQPALTRSSLLHRKLTDLLPLPIQHIQRQADTAAHSTGCSCPTCGPAAGQVQRKEASHGPGCSCPNCAGQGGKVQTKLTVGAPQDQYEQEADRVAAQVMQMPAPQPQPVHSVQRHGQGHEDQAQRHGDHDDQAQRHEEEDQAQTKAIGDTITPIAQRHEDHDDQAQTKPMVTPVSVQQAGAASGRIQRHSSWEHQLLGDVPPDKLAQLGSWQDLIKKGKHIDTPEVDIQGVGKIKKGNVMHVIAQELKRLEVWQKNPPKGASDTDKQGLKQHDPTWDVVLVSLPNTKNPKEPLVVTYGELNTLADYYGSADIMKNADPTNRWQIVQSVRQETFFRLKDIYTKLQGSLSDTDKQDQDVQSAEAMMQGNKLVNQKVGFKFKGAMTPDYISSLKGQLDLLAGDKPLIGQGTGAKGDTNSYGATLARNACHFVPESWHSWANYHNIALGLARQAFDKKMAAIPYARKAKQDPASADGYRGTAKKLREESSELANEALLNNGFGDHYLQDSYASGHMINKTQIMQWYIEYIETSKTFDYFKDKNWRKVQQMAYKQPGIVDSGQYDKSRVKGHRGNTSVGGGKQGPVLPAREARNPQSVENMAGDWLTRFKALGLQVPTSLQTAGSPERQLVEWWQKEAMKMLGSRKKSGDTLQTKSPLQGQPLRSALKSLLHDGIIKMSGSSLESRGLAMRDSSTITIPGTASNEFKKLDFTLRDDYVPKNKKNFKQALVASAQGDDSQYQKMAASVTYGDYFEFMKSGFIQKSTNALHDAFCQKGLEVSSGEGQPVFKVYGDDAMFNQESAAGVKHSGETANMSRDSVLNMIATGTEAGIPTTKIINRLPAYVKVKGFSDVTKLEDWHNPKGGPSLKTYCFSKIFPSMSWDVKQKMAPGVVGSDLGKISKDETVHGSDAF